MRVRTRATNRASASSLLMVIGLLLILSGGTAAETAVMVEGEDFLDFLDIGGGMIQIASCGSASQGYVADYIDVPGEWIRLAVTFQASGSFEPFVAYQAYAGNTVGLRVTIRKGSPGGEDISSDFSLVGSGIG